MNTRPVLHPPWRGGADRRDERLDKFERPDGRTCTDRRTCTPLFPTHHPRCRCPPLPASHPGSAGRRTWVVGGPSNSQRLPGSGSSSDRASERACEQVDVIRALTQPRCPSLGRCHCCQVYKLGENPSAYASAHFAYWAQMDPERTPRNQSCIVSGESGAGKTVSCGAVMKYLARRAVETSNGQSNCQKSATFARHAGWWTGTSREAFGMCAAKIAC